MLKASFISKLTIVTLGLIAIIILGSLMGHCSNKVPEGGSDYTYCNAADSSAAALEWFIAVLFCLYIFSIIFDLYPARYTSKHRQTAPRELMQPTNPRVAKRPTVDAPVGTFSNGENAHAVPVASGTTLV